MSTKQLNQNTRITFIGGGNMGRALISGLLANGFEAINLPWWRPMPRPPLVYIAILVFK